MTTIVDLLVGGMARLRLLIWDGPTTLTDMGWFPTQHGQVCAPRQRGELAHRSASKVTLRIGHHGSRNEKPQEAIKRLPD